MSEENLIKKLEELKVLAFEKTSPKISILKEIKGELYSIDKNKRDFLKHFVSGLNDQLFKSSITIPGLDLENYFNNSDPVLKVSKGKVIEVEIKEEQVEITFDELLKELLKCIKDTIIDLKGYAIIKLSNQEYSKYKIKVLYDENYYHEPIKHKITKVFSECDSSKIETFKNKLEEGGTPDTNLLCLVLLTSKINNKTSQITTNNSLNEIINSFDNFEYCTINDFGNYTGDFYKRSVDKQSFLDEISFVTSKFLSNGKTSYEEEKVIKKVFENSNALVLNYKLLQAGNSGSKVMEVNPVTTQTSGGYDRRFIIKYSKKDDERKLKTEITNFTNYIEAYEGSNEYKCTHYETSNFEALKYDFAKSPGSLDSYSFAEILKSSENPYFEKSNEIINELFNLEIFTRWHTESSIKELCSLENLYSKYVNLKKIKEQVLIVKHWTEKDFDNSEFKIKLDKLLNHKIEINKKICHGDLHSENFFKDEQGKIFLIDFGHTGIEHSVIDHTSLECSIKFRHIPRYIKLETLINLEKELILENTFNNSYTFNVLSERKDLLRYCEIIKQTRNNSQQYLLEQNSKIEYYVSLFFMTYRQVRYKEMNQLYAIESANIILDKLIIEFGL